MVEPRGFQNRPRVASFGRKTDLDEYMEIPVPDLAISALHESSPLFRAVWRSKVGNVFVTMEAVPGPRGVRVPAALPMLNAKDCRAVDDSGLMSAVLPVLGSIKTENAHHCRKHAHAHASLARMSSRAQHGLPAPLLGALLCRPRAPHAQGSTCVAMCVRARACARAHVQTCKLTFHVL